MYIFLTVFLMLLFLILSFLVFSLRLFVMSNEIGRAFNMNCADLITKIRIDHFVSISETNPESISLNIGTPSSENYRRTLLNDLVRMIASSLGCDYAYDSGWVIVKEGSGEDPAYMLTGFIAEYGNSIGTIRAKLHIPVFFNGRFLGQYVRDLEYSFSLSYKQ